MEYMLVGRGGASYSSRFFKILNPLHETPQIIELAKRTFTNWTDDGVLFEETLAGRANYASLIYSGKRMVAFNLYEKNMLSTAGTDDINFVYMHYSGVDPEYRGQGLMIGSWIHDLRIMKPNVVAGCTSAGAILKGMRSVSKEFGWRIYPEIDMPVPPAIGNLGRAIYTKLKGPSVGMSVDTATLHRHGNTPYARGLVSDPLQETLKDPNDAILYVCVSRPRKVIEQFDSA